MSIEYIPDEQEHVVAIVSFEGALKREIKRVREQLRQCDALSNFSLTIHAEGRLHEGEVKLTFGLGSWNNEVKGDALNAVIEEFMRRNGWEALHAPKALAYNKIVSDDD